MTRKDLKFYIKEDNRNTNTKIIFWLWSFLTNNLEHQRKKYLIHLKKNEYYRTKGKLFFTHRFYHQVLKNRIGNRFGWEIPPFTCGYGLHLGHSNIVINAGAKIGNYAYFYANNCLGRKGKSSNLNSSPLIGNNVTFGFGSCAIGNVKIGDNCFICANAVVTKSFEENNLIIVGNPAIKLNN